MTFYLFFVFYTATEIGLANWLSTWAVLNKIMSEVTAANLNTVYYGVFTATRVLAAPIAWCGVSSRALLATCLVLAMGSVVTLWLAIKQQSFVLCFVPSLHCFSIICTFSFSILLVSCCMCFTY